MRAHTALWWLSWTMSLAACSEDPALPWRDSQSTGEPTAPPSGTPGGSTSGSSGQPPAGDRRAIGEIVFAQQGTLAAARATVHARFVEWPGAADEWPQFATPLPDGCSQERVVSAEADAAVCVRVLCSSPLSEVWSAPAVSAGVLTLSGVASVNALSPDSQRQYAAVASNELPLWQPLTTLGVDARGEAELGAFRAEVMAPAALTLLEPSANEQGVRWLSRSGTRLRFDGAAEWFGLSAQFAEVLADDGLRRSRMNLWCEARGAAGAMILPAEALRGLPDDTSPSALLLHAESRQALEVDGAVPAQVRVRALHQVVRADGTQLTPGEFTLAP